jgi:hypothetical protein
VRRQSCHTSLRRVAEEVAARENACPQPVVMTDRAFAFQAKQLSSKHHAQSPSDNQQQPALRAYTTFHRVPCAELKGNAITTAEIGLQLLQGGLKPVQERGALYEAADELRLCAASLDQRAFIHLWRQDYLNTIAFTFLGGCGQSEATNSADLRTVAKHAMRWGGGAGENGEFGETDKVTISPLLENWLAVRFCEDVGKNDSQFMITTHSEQEDKSSGLERDFGYVLNHRTVSPFLVGRDNICVSLSQACLRSKFETRFQFYCRSAVRLRAIQWHSQVFYQPGLTPKSAKSSRVPVQTAEAH